MNAKESRKSLVLSSKDMAKEINEYLSDNFMFQDIDRISFICHSLGGVIARDVAVRLKKYQKKFYAYCSFATPHLGVSSQKGFKSFGMWLSKIFYGYECLDQLTLQDADDVKGK